MMRNIGLGGTIAILTIMRAFRPVVFLIIAVGITVTAQVVSATASEQYVSRVGKMALNVARGNDSITQKVTDLRSILRRFTDMKSIALFSLGKYQRKLPSGKMLLYIDLMENFVAKFMIGFSKQFAGKRLKILRSKKRSSSDTIVESQIIYGKDVSPAPVKWRVITRHGKPKIFDVQILGVWMTLRLRSQFLSVLKQNNGNFDALFAYMRR